MKIKIPEPFQELFTENKYRYKIYHGGRGGGKTVNFGIALLLMAMQKPMRILCVREIQKSIRDSVHKNLKDIIDDHSLKSWVVTQNSIRFVNGSEFIFCGLSGNAQQIKSMANIDICWVEEAQTISFNSINVLIPTIRKENSEIWFSFNRLTENDPVYEYFCINPDERTFVRQVNYDENPCFPGVLEEERLRAKKNLTEDEYEHIWLGNPKSFLEESYYGKHIRKAEQEGRICKAVYNPTLQVHTAWDLGMSDAMAIWFFQVYGKEIRLIDYYENSGEGLEFYSNVLEEKSKEELYKYGTHFAPHDIRVRELGTGISRLEISYRLGLNFEVLPKIDLYEGIQCCRHNFHRLWFDSETTRFGLKCIKNYRKEYDEKRQCYKNKPLHDWTSHCADSFRYLLQAVEIINPALGIRKTERELKEEFDKEYDNHYSKRCDVTGY